MTGAGGTWGLGGPASASAGGGEGWETVVTESSNYTTKQSKAESTGKDPLGARRK